MRTIVLKREDIYTGNLVLINTKHMLYTDETEKQETLIPFDSVNKHILLDVRAAAVLSLLFSELQCKDSIIPVSGYRTVEEQIKIYMESVRENGEEFTRKYVAMPDTSEHQTGLAIDLAKNKGNGYTDFICPELPYDGIFGKFRRKAVKYGFIERYPEGKEKITGISHEPWHFRYVGHPHSEIMTENKMVLEEYIEYIKTYRYKENHLITRNNIEIFYVNCSETLNRTVEIPKKSLYQISGNNTDGFIVTLWREDR